MPEPLKRVIVLLTSRWLEAHDVQKWLREHGVEAKLVCKHSVQVAPDLEEKAKEVIAKYPYTWGTGGRKK
jgi:hypothetical protein